MSELPKSFGGPAMAMSEYYDPDAGDAEDDYDDEDNPAKVSFHKFISLCLIVLGIKIKIQVIDY